MPAPPPPPYSKAWEDLSHILPKLTPRQASFLFTKECFIAILDIDTYSVAQIIPVNEVLLHSKISIYACVVAV